MAAERMSTAAMAYPAMAYPVAESAHRLSLDRGRARVLAHMRLHEVQRNLEFFTNPNPEIEYRGAGLLKDVFHA